MNLLSSLNVIPCKKIVSLDSLFAGKLEDVSYKNKLEEKDKNTLGKGR